jgi:hypothetical protein
MVSACSRAEEEIPVGFKKQQFDFKDIDGGRFYLHGHVQLFVPAKYDTLLIWNDRSDAGGMPKYRFTNSKGCLLQESGFLKPEGTYCTDTLDRLTIETQQSFGLGLDTVSLERMAYMSEAEKRHHEMMHRVYPAWKAPILKEMKRERINGRTFVIKQFYGSWKLVPEPYKHLTAVTELKQGPSLWVTAFHFECKQQDCHDFAKNAYTVLQSVKIDTLSAGDK